MSEEPPSASARPSRRAGMSVEQYDWHVRDMAKNLLHAAGIYIAAQVAGLTRLFGHPFFRDPGAGGWRELAVFAAGFLGAWAVFYSTLLRDAGLRSWTVTIVVPLAVLAAAAIWLIFPGLDAMTTEHVWWAIAMLCGPGPVAWAVTMRRWRIEKRRAQSLLAEPGVTEPDASQHDASEPGA